MEELSPEEFEIARRKNLEALQEAATKYQRESVWKRVFRYRGLQDAGSAQSWALCPEYMWVPVEPYESMMEYARRIERGSGESARQAICQRCALGEPIQWEGRREDGGQLWFHYVTWQHPLPPPTLIERIMARFGYAKPEPERKEGSMLELCPASAIIRAFALIDIPATLPGVNLGAYPEPAPPYGDPEAR